jgi:hypothetical protein
VDLKTLAHIQNAHKRPHNGAGQSLPINFTAFSLVTINDQNVSFELGLRYWADSPFGGPEDLAFRVNVTFLFPN